MQLVEKEILIPARDNQDGLLEYLGQAVAAGLNGDEIPVRVAVTRTDSEGYHCEVGILSGVDHSKAESIESMFDLRRREYENNQDFNAALLVPTGIGAEIGGHSGDAGAVARLMAASCDNLITHPNVVNAADINELPENGLYVEGSVISRLMMGTVGLQKVRSNRVMMIVDQHTDKMFHELSINSASAARAALGLDCPLVVKMEDRILMRALFSKSGRAVGQIEFLEYLCEVLEEHRSEYDAVALTSLISVPERFHSDYFDKDSDMAVNPWGGVEAMLTHAISMLFNVPSAHSPMMTSSEVMNLDVGIVDPRKSAEAVSSTYLHCILKGLHRSPRVVPDIPIHGDPGLLTVANVSCLVIPDGCVGLPTLAALEQGIPVIAVKENKNCMRNRLEDLPFAPGKLFIVENYLEAAGIMTALRAGVAVDTVRRPLADTVVVNARRQHHTEFAPAATEERTSRV
ncbi:MAG: DUF3326 domain-containing protein [Verrucomicrobia bacterium]|jgi:hypothetical protein|nr:DUF3326 domain-containing protein [Verrucomicrobiota bacterium]MBT7700195.1 DUF3326 domain-containing protein [Verrucomicrobiota bacterium]